MRDILLKSDVLDSKMSPLWDSPTMIISVIVGETHFTKIKANFAPPYTPVPRPDNFPYS